MEKVEELKQEFFDKRNIKDSAVIERRTITIPEEDRQIDLIGLHHGHPQHLVGLRNMYEEETPSHILAELCRTESSEYSENATEFKLIRELVGKEGMVGIDRDEVVTMCRICKEFYNSDTVNLFKKYLTSVPLVRPFNAEEKDRLVKKSAILADFFEFLTMASKPCDENITEDEIQVQFWEVVYPFLRVAEVYKSITDERENVMFYNMIQFLKDHPNAKKIFVVTGKFHTQSLEKRWNSFYKQYILGEEPKEEVKDEALVQLVKSDPSIHVSENVEDIADENENLSKEQRAYQEYLTRHYNEYLELTKVEKNEPSWGTPFILGGILGYGYKRYSLKKFAIVGALTIPVWTMRENYYEDKYKYMPELIYAVLGGTVGLNYYKFKTKYPTHKALRWKRRFGWALLGAAGLVGYRSISICNKITNIRQEMKEEREQKGIKSNY